MHYPEQFRAELRKRGLDIPLDLKTQSDIMSLVLLHPGEVGESFRTFINNEEFEHPSQSML